MTWKNELFQRERKSGQFFLSRLLGDFKVSFGCSNLNFFVHLAIQNLNKSAKLTKKPKFEGLKSFNLSKSSRNFCFFYISLNLSVFEIFGCKNVHCYPGVHYCFNVVQTSRLTGHSLEDMALISINKIKFSYLQNSLLWDFSTKRHSCLKKSIARHPVLLLIY